MMEALYLSEISFLTRAIRRNIQDDGILQNHTPWLPSPQANYTDRSNVTGRRILVPTFVDRGVSVVSEAKSPRTLISVF
jgi:hypothetical protein